MNKIFAIDSPLMRFLKKAANLMLLNLLWLICCLPIVTVGASTGAMYRVVLELARDEELGITKSFFRALREDWLKSTGLFFVILLSAVVAVVDFWFITRGIVQMPIIIRAVAAIPLLLFFLAFGYVLPLHAKFENTIGNTVKNAVFLSLRHIGCTLLLISTNCLPLLILLISVPLFLQASLFWLCIGTAWIAYLQMKALNRWVFAKLISEEPTQDDQ